MTQMISKLSVTLSKVLADIQSEHHENKNSFDVSFVSLCRGALQ